MTYDVYRMIFIGGLALSVLMLIISVVMFFKMNIRRVMGEYNGTTKRKAIEKIRKKTSGEVTTSANLKTKKSVDIGRKESNNNFSSSGETSKIKAQDRFDAFEAPETTTLSAYNADPAKENISQVESKQYVSYPKRDDFVVITDITYVHSSEVIQ